MKSAVKVTYLNNLFQKDLQVQWDDLSTYNELIEIYFELYKGVDPSMCELKTERMLIERALRMGKARMNSHHLDMAFSGRDNIFEIYRLDYSQMYRSLSFMRFETYSLIELMTKSNFDLYEREGHYVPMVQEQVLECIQKDAPLQFSIPTHKVWERLVKRPKHHWKMTLGMCAPVYNEDESEQIGVFVSHNTTQIFEPPFRRTELKLV